VCGVCAGCVVLCVCVCGVWCVCGVCVVSLAALWVRFPVWSGDVFLFQYDTHEADALQHTC